MFYLREAFSLSTMSFRKRLPWSASVVPSRSEKPLSETQRSLQFTIYGTYVPGTNWNKPLGRPSWWRLCPQRAARARRGEGAPWAAAGAWQPRGPPWRGGFRRGATPPRECWMRSTWSRERYGRERYGEEFDYALTYVRTYVRTYVHITPINSVRYRNRYQNRRRHDTDNPKTLHARYTFDIWLFILRSFRSVSTKIITWGCEGMKGKTGSIRYVCVYRTIYISIHRKYRYDVQHQCK